MKIPRKTLERFTRAMRIAAIAILGCASTIGVPAAAQTFPTKPIRLVIPWNPGGTADLTGRELARRMGTVLGQPVVVDNRPGANGILGTDIAAQAAPDGYTMMLSSPFSHLVNQWTHKKLPYDPLADFAPLTEIRSVRLVLVAHPAFPATSVAELVQLAKARPGKVSFASFGTSSMSHLAGELLKSVANIELVHVPYNGETKALVDVLSGEVPLFFAAASVLPHIKSGKLRALAAVGNTRIEDLPDVPAIAETAGLEAYDIPGGSLALWVPTRTPSDVVAKLNAAAVKEIQTPEFRRFVATGGFGAPIGSTPDKMAADISKGAATITRLVKAAGIQPQ